MVWPEPFSSFADALQVLSFFATGFSCINSSYNYYIRVIVSTLMPIMIATLIALVYFARLAAVRTSNGRDGRATPSDEQARTLRSRIFRQHAYIFILVTYIFMPSTSVDIMRLLRACKHGFGEMQNEAFLNADFKLLCYTTDVDSGVRHYDRTYRTMLVYAYLMILLYPVGINVMYFVLLYRHRNLINPPKMGIDHAIVSRNANPRVAHLSFLFKHYKPSAYLYEVIDSMRRLLLGGVYVLFSEGSDEINCVYNHAQQSNK